MRGILSKRWLQRRYVVAPLLVLDRHDLHGGDN
jgi:hypothetical protein